MEFDENDAVRYMRKSVEPELNARYADDDELLNLIDLIFDYFEANGLLEIDASDDDDEIDFDDLMEYVKRMLAKDKQAVMTPEDAQFYVKAYFNYEDSLDC